ncbi:MAG: hypothetical protein Alpg2KO_10550 [Alphaproteobacteria bacterium]
MTNASICSNGDRETMRKIGMSKKGVSILSYALLLGLIGAIALAVLDDIGKQNVSLYDTVANRMADPSGGTGSSANSNDSSPPSVADASFSVNELDPQGTVLGTVSASDDLGVTALTITGGNQDGHFELSASGVLSTTAAFVNSANLSGYSLTIQAEDAEGNSSTGTITVTVNQAVMFLFVTRDTILGTGFASSRQLFVSPPGVESRQTAETMCSTDDMAALCTGTPHAMMSFSTTDQLVDLPASYPSGINTDIPVWWLRWNGSTAVTDAQAADDWADLVDLPSDARGPGIINASPDSRITWTFSENDGQFDSAPASDSCEHGSYSSDFTDAGRAAAHDSTASNWLAVHRDRCASVSLPIMCLCQGAL